MGKHCMSASVFYTATQVVFRSGVKVSSHTNQVTTSPPTQQQ